MFLPVLLVRDYGVGGWVVFAVPNIVGAAAMGWVIRSATASRGIVEQHRAACVVFSLVTIAFQFFFAGWLLTIEAAVLLIAPLALVQLALRADRWVAVGVWIVSAGAFAILIGSGEAFGEPNLPIDLARQPAGDLLWLAPVCVFGFLLCPYLDLTFHRARQAFDAESAERRAMSDEEGAGSDEGSEIANCKLNIENSPPPDSSLIAHRSALNAPARLAFGLGFGVFFSIMILFTLAYAGLLVGAAADIPVRGPTLMLQAIGAHIALQLIFTVAVHMRAVHASVDRPSASWGLLIGAVAIGVLLALSRVDDAITQPPLLPERIYRGFMGFYGLVFPAYVWLCMIPSASPRRARTVFAIVVLAALPMFWMGFMEQRMIWLLPGVLVVLLARFLLARKPLPTPDT